MVLPLQPTEVPGVYRRGSRFVVVYRAEGRQRKQSADTLSASWTAPRCIARQVHCDLIAHRGEHMQLAGSWIDLTTTPWCNSHRERADARASGNAHGYLPPRARGPTP